MSEPTRDWQPQPIVPVTRPGAPSASYDLRTGQGTPYVDGRAVHDCDPPDPMDQGEYGLDGKASWTCPVCAAVYELRVDAWWEPKDS